MSTTLRDSISRAFRQVGRELSSPRRKLLALFRAAWAKPGDKDGWFASRYFDLTRSESPARFVDDTTWVDLEFPAIFTNIDTTVTPIGSQVLFRRLREYVDDADELAARYDACHLLRADQSLREHIQLQLAALRDDASASIAEFVFGRTPARPKYAALVIVWSLVSIAALLAIPLLSAPPALWLSIVVTNFILVHVASPRIYRETEAFKACARMLRTADRLSALRPPEALGLPFDELVRHAPARAKARRSLSWFSVSQDSLVLGTLSTLLNVAFLAELLAYIRLVGRFPALRPELASAFRVLGGLDAAIAVASYLERCPDHCRAQISDDALIDIQNGYHPLVSRPVTNSIRLQGRSALVTGSNMAGKTTFVKMIGVNIIFARILGFCLATQAIVPRSAAMASIRGEHSVASGKSHYQAEIEAILSFIWASAAGECRVFLIDELFSGTNTIERIAAARAVLEELGANAQVLVTTHDVELQGLLAGRFDLYHFHEDPDIEGYFDYQLKPGATTTRNAIRLLHRFGFPDEVVSNAMSYAQARLSEPWRNEAE